MATAFKTCAQDFTRAYVITNSLGMAIVMIASQYTMVAWSRIR